MSDSSSDSGSRPDQRDSSSDSGSRPDQRDEQVPTALTEGGARIQERDYGSAFARLPDDETHPVERPGSGPAGGLDGPLNAPLIAVWVGIGVLFATFLIGHWMAIVAGLALIVIGAGWSITRHRPIRLYRGVGTIRKPARR